MIDVADSFGVPSYMFFTSKGITVNTFLKLESYPLKFLQSEQDLPKVYTVGPIVNVRDLGDSDTTQQDSEEVLRWLDQQPAASVVFLCFGSMGSFDEDQVRENRHRPREGRTLIPVVVATITAERQYWVPDQLRHGFQGGPPRFLERTVRVRRVLGWAPQAKILAHQSTGGFVSHCGWNSTLERIWFGVPMATWPLYTEQQQFNAFQLVKEMGLAAEIRIDYRRDFRMESEGTVSSDEIEWCIRELMEDFGEKRRTVKELSDISRDVLKGGCSSYVAIEEFINDIIGNAS